MTHDEFCERVKIATKVIYDAVGEANAAGVKAGVVVLVVTEKDGDTEESIITNLTDECELEVVRRALENLESEPPKPEEYSPGELGH